MSAIDTFISNISTIFASGAATEHSYRAPLQALFQSLSDDLEVINEPKRTKVGAPDFILSQYGIPVGHVEAKDIGLDIRNLKDRNADQRKKYLDAFDNLIYTNCLDWDFYRDKQLIASVSIGDYRMGIQPKPENFETLINLLQDFIAQTPRSVTSPKDLAERMAGKAKLVKDILFATLKEDEGQRTELELQYEGFKDSLIHDITPEDFADVYAETIAYGMFAARLHDPTQDTFSREETWSLLPKNFPFLRDLFLFVAGPNLDDRLTWILDDLARVFLATDLTKIMAGFGTMTGQNDPFLHFYETFLAAYNPAKRKSRGVWYTPEPVVNFIVRAVDEVLQTEFGLADGLADTSKITIDWDTGQRKMKADGKTPTKDGKNQIEQREVHRVQILDPATGTGTFLAEVVKLVAGRIQGLAPGMWSQYVEEELIPRLHGFELLMASYAMCHMKLDMILTDMGYTPGANPPRLSVYLTNSLEEGEPANQSLPFAGWVAREAKGANEIKTDMPIMCVIGNPPYLGEGGVSEGWLGDLMDDYKKEPGGIEKLKERNPKWLNDLYVKFIRMSSHLIERNGEGILGFITNHGYLDNPTFRGMRWHLLKSFDKIWIVDLHGNSKKKEVTPEGLPDKNVFDIQQGVAIIIGVKKKDGGDGLAEVHHLDLWGDRKGKYESLSMHRLKLNINEKLDPHPHYQMFYPVDNITLDKYDFGFSISEFMSECQIGLTTSRDHLAVDFTSNELRNKISRFVDLSRNDEVTRKDFFGSKKGKDGRLAGDTSSWSMAKARRALAQIQTNKFVKELDYRPLDHRFVYYSKHMIERPREEIIPNMFQESNFAISFNRKIDEIRPFSDAFIFENAVQLHSLSIKESNYFAPLYLSPDEQDLDQSRRINFDDKLWAKLKILANHPTHGEPDEVQTFDYIYGVLHCPAYRNTYAEFLKIDFPRLPWPKTPDEFWDVAAKGETLRKLHLMEPAAIGETPYPFDGEGENTVDKPAFKEGRVYINETQYFDAAPEISWGFYIGGYQPAQKWLKDRKGRQLSFDDVKHYQRILKILSETDRIMKTITMDLA